MIRLISLDSFPPGGFSYVQNEGVYKKFGGSDGARDLANRVANFRRGNGLPRASQAEALIDIDQYTCARLNNDPAWCSETDQSILQNAGLPSAAPCATCGAQVT